jgi:hypothetical protein
MIQTSAICAINNNNVIEILVYDKDFDNFLDDAETENIQISNF